MVASPRNQRSQGYEHFAFPTYVFSFLRETVLAPLGCGQPIPVRHNVGAQQCRCDHSNGQEHSGTNAAFVSSFSVTGGGHRVRTSVTALLPLVLDAVSGSSSFDASLCRLSPASSSARLCLVMRGAIQFERPVCRERDFVVSMVSVNDWESLLKQGIARTDCAGGIHCNVFIINIL
jgi:hypothetical protein